jgi:hypothetical protein
MTKELRFTFEEVRAVQACGVLLRAASGRENYTKLLKVLYLADRVSLLETGQTITGATVVSMKHGPVLSEVYECIMGDPDGGFWDRYIRKLGYDMELLEDPGDDRLSDFEVNTLTGLASKYAWANYLDMIKIVHGLPEWRDPAPAKVASLPASEILRSMGVTDDSIANQANRVSYLDEVDKLLRPS